MYSYTPDVCNNVLLYAGLVEYGIPVLLDWILLSSQVTVKYIESVMEKS